MPFKKAVKYDAKLRLAIAGPSGAGKTYTALTLATALAGDKGVALIDTERGSASKYAKTADGNGFDFDVMELTSYHPKLFIQAIHEAEQAGYGVLIIDSLTHAWNGPGGVLEIVDVATKRSSSKNSFNAWGEATPWQNALIDTITRSSLHVICTMRSKTEYVIEQQSNGKSAPRKVGTAPVQRQDIEYEYDVYGTLTLDHELLIEKSRCSDLSNRMIGPESYGSMAEVLRRWLAGAVKPVQAADPEPASSHTSEPVREEPTLADPEPATEAQLRSISQLADRLKKTIQPPKTYEQAKTLIQTLSAEYRESRKAS